MTNAPKRGDRFTHRRVTDEHGTPQTYIVTRVASGWVYHRSTYADGTKGGLECCPLSDFDRIANRE